MSQKLSKGALPSPKLKGKRVETQTTANYRQNILMIQILFQYQKLYYYLVVDVI